MTSPSAFDRSTSCHGDHLRRAVKNFPHFCVVREFIAFPGDREDDSVRVLHSGRTGLRC
jgi:hypothetical protein